ncbi:MAG: hypothetical protein Q9184_005133 [Pyrenodesmia sp. 2 TL-2023]
MLILRIKCAIPITNHTLEKQILQRILASSDDPTFNVFIQAMNLDWSRRLIQSETLEVKFTTNTIENFDPIPACDEEFVEVRYGRETLTVKYRLKEEVGYGLAILSKISQ